MTFIIMAQPRRKDADLETGRPLSYGRDKEPAQDQLLFRGRATVFATKDQAWLALSDSLKTSEDEGGTWVKKHQYFLVELTENT